MGKAGQPSRQSSLIQSPKPQHPFDTAGGGQYLAMLRFRIASEETTLNHKRGMCNALVHPTPLAGEAWGGRDMEVWNEEVAQEHKCIHM